MSLRLLPVLISFGASPVLGQASRPAVEVTPGTSPALQPATQPATQSAADTAGDNHLRGGPNDVHALIIDDAAGLFSQGDAEGVVVRRQPDGVAIRPGGRAFDAATGFHVGVHTSRPIEAGFPFNDVVPSWNVDVPEGSGFIVELRVGRRQGDFWTPFYYLGTWGNAPTGVEKHLQDENGLIDIDCFRSERAFDRLQYRVRLFAAATGRSPVLRRFALAYSNTLDDADLARRHSRSFDPGPRQLWARRLPVPFRSQGVEDPRIRSSICSPTSLAMVLEYYGINHPTAEVAEAVFDREYEIYGNWARAVQAAYTFGIPGYLERFGDWNAVKRHISAGHPVIASIRAQRGELAGAPYNASNGHLIVIAGFDEEGNVLVNDPAGDNPSEGQVSYRREDLEKVWFGHGGVGYVLVGRGAIPPRQATTRE